MLRYHSEERCLALRLCGWISRGPEIDMEAFLRSLEQEREWERAAAVALFNLDIRRAIQILNKGAAAEKGERSSEGGGTGNRCVLEVMTGKRNISDQTYITAVVVLVNSYYYILVRLQIIVSVVCLVSKKYVKHHCAVQNGRSHQLILTLQIFLKRL